MSRLLLVEDDDRLRGALAILLRSHGHVVVEAGSVQEAGENVLQGKYDCAVIDLGLPDGTGNEIIRALRDADTRVVIIVLSARRLPADKVTALDVGADDYVTKPFGVDELLARIRAALRRSDSELGSPVLMLGDVAVDFHSRRVMSEGGLEIRLTPTEWSVLECLKKAGGRVVPSSELLHEVWGSRGVGQAHYVRVYLAQLRQKLEPDPGMPRYLLTVPGVGYRFTSGDQGLASRP